MKHPTEKIYRGAVIGIGRMGSKIDDEQKYFYFPYPWSHGGAMVESKRVELVAGSDLLGEQREDFRNRWGIDAVYEDFREMLAKEDIEFVSITTKHEERADVIMACAEAKVEIIYPTKPFCNTLVEGDTVIRACREAGSLLAVSCHQNWNPWFHACRKSIEHGDIGKITAIISQNNLNDHNAALMRMSPGHHPNGSWPTSMGRVPRVSSGSKTVCVGSTHPERGNTFKSLAPTAGLTCATNTANSSCGAAFPAGSLPRWWRDSKPSAAGWPGRSSGPHAISQSANTHEFPTRQH